nr:MAG: glucose-regulated metallo-peptidase M90 [Bacteriophage sp.]
MRNIKVKLVKELGGSMAYYSDTNTIEVLDKTFNRELPEDITKHFNHELIHAYTVSEYDNNSIFRQHVNIIYNKLINTFPEKEYPRKGLYYGLKSPKEFISEIMSNTAFRDLVGKHDMSTWRKFLTGVLWMLGLNKLVNKVEGYTTTKLINEISDIIENRNINPDINRLGDGIFYMEDSDPSLNKLSKDSKKILDKIMNGLNGRYKSLRAQNYPLLQLAKLQ